MKTLTILAALALLAAIALLVVNESRVDRKISAAWRDRPDVREIPPVDSSELHEARVSLQRAQMELASAHAQIAALSAKVSALERGDRSPMTRREKSPPPLMEGAPPPESAPAADNPVPREWGPEQATGPADTLVAGDVPTAWAPLLQDGGAEWLKLDYEKVMDLAEVRVHETCNPGAISKVTAFLTDGREVTIWEGVEPEAVAPVVRLFAVPFSAQTSSVKVYLDTKRIPGWNEIDAVELVGRDSTRQWAKKASASSTFAEMGSARIRFLGGEGFELRLEPRSENR